MDLHSNRPSSTGLKNPVVKLERCDKIWKTLQLIRSMQDKHLEDIQDWIKREPIASDNTLRKQPPMTYIPDKSLPLNLIGEPNLPRPQIKYQPIFNNGNELLPQFQLAEKSRVYLYHCEVCSQEYCDYKRFTEHQEKVHAIIMPKKLVARKEKIQKKSSGDAKSRRNSTESNNYLQLNSKFVTDENIDWQPIVRNLPPQTDGIQCKLCNKSYKNIKRHMIDYHKISSIGVLNNATDCNSNLDNEQSVQGIESMNHALPELMDKTVDQTKEIPLQDANFSIQKINVSKRKQNMPNIGRRKRLRNIGFQKDELDTETQNETMKSEFCGKEYINNKTFCKYRSRHRNCSKEQQSLKPTKNMNESVNDDTGSKANGEISTCAQDQDKDNNNADKKTSRTRSTSTKECNSADALKNGNVILSGNSADDFAQIKCACGRTFRTTSILANHKFGCKFLNEIETCKSTEIRTGNDRDSGISITIKKKNNSYEIVSKDGSDDEPLRNERNIGEPYICEETSDSSSSNSDSSEFDDHQDNLVPEASKYSVNHCILKLHFTEENVDVDIEDDECGEAGNDKSNFTSENMNQVPLLRVLCKKLLIDRGIMPEQATTHKCQTCKMFLGNRETLLKHIDKHKKLMKRSCRCGIKFTSMKAFDDHIAAVHPKCTICPYCKEKYRSIVGLGEHLCWVTQGVTYTETFNENHPCPNCNIVFNNITWLQSHMKSKHLDLNLPFQCYQCLEKFPNEIARSLHFRKKHNRASACSICYQKFQSFKTRQKHEAYHRGVGFPCHICKKTYPARKNQLNHVKNVHSDFSNDKLECFICQKSIKTKSFKKHVLRHSSTLECKICKKVVYDFRNLERHIMDHHASENYPRKKCNACGVSFPTAEQLEAHIMVEKSIKK